MRLALGRLGLAWVVIMAAASTASADSIWQEHLGDDEVSAFERAIRIGDSLAMSAAEVRGGSLRYRKELAKRAVRAYEDACLADPAQGEPHYRAAEVLYGHFLRESRTAVDRSVARQAIEHWSAFERLAPLDPRITDILARRSILYTQLGHDEDLKQALADYEQLLRRSDLSENAIESARLLSNLAEILMMLGRLDESITIYRRALEFANTPLHGYGLAVALDRNGEGIRAREVMAHYAQYDRLRALSQDLVFFVPYGEAYYYYALGYEALGDIEKAIVHYRQFLRSGAQKRYQSRAQSTLDRLLKEQRSARSRSNRGSRL